MLHNLGCAVVPSSMLDGAATPSAANQERMRLHGYWTRRILERCPSLTDLEPLTRPAAALHAAFAEGGYRRWTRPADLPEHASLPLETRLLEAAEAYASLTEPRPGRPALAEDERRAGSRPGRRRGRPGRRGRRPRAGRRRAARSRGGALPGA